VAITAEFKRASRTISSERVTGKPTTARRGSACDDAAASILPHLRSRAGTLRNAKVGPRSSTLSKGCDGSVAKIAREKRVGRDLRVLRLHMCADCAAIAIVGDGRKNIIVRVSISCRPGVFGSAPEKRSGWVCRDSGERPRPVSAITGANPPSAGFDIPTGELLRIADVKMRQNAVPCAA
jgi:hypothetical protein